MIHSISFFKAQQNISLISPFDLDTIDTKNPLLLWSYFGNKDLKRTKSRIIIVGLEDDQSSEAGIIVNQPLVKMDDLLGTQLFYPYDAPPLEEGHRYGWQVQEISNNVIINKSEAWEFILPIKPIEKPIYHRIKSKADATVYKTHNGIFYFYLKNRYNEKALTFFLYDDRGKLLSENILLNPSNEEEFQEVNIQKRGMNYYQLNLGEFALNGVYKLVIVDSKGVKYRTNFKVN